MTAPERINEPQSKPASAPILVVDDSKAQRRLLTRTLEKWGFETIEAASGVEALQLCKSMAFDVIISDWMMPGMSGVEFCKTFRSQSSQPAFFLLLTAQTEREILAEGLESGADDFLSKPFHAVELRARLMAGQRSVQAQKALAGQNRKLTDTLDELSEAYAAIERDLKGARAFQESLLPERHVTFDEADVTLLFRSSGHVGGDLVGYFPVRPGEIGVFSVDVSGHGVASALMTARVASYFSAIVPERNIALVHGPSGPEMAPLEDVFAQLNEVLIADNDTDLYLTMTLAHIDINARTVKLCQAGHPSPAVQRSDGSVEFVELWSTPIGLIDDGEYAVSTLTLGESDRLFLYSDGVTECPDPNGELLDEEGFANLLTRAANCQGLALVEELTGSLVEFHGKLDFPDDLSALVVEFHAP